MNTEELLKERGKTHGDYSDHATLTQLFKLHTALALRRQKKVLSAEHQEALDMIFHKIGRIVAGDPNVEDHWKDLSGYSELARKSIENGKSGREGTVPTPPFVKEAYTAKEVQEACQTSVWPTTKANYPTYNYQLEG